MDFKKSYFRRKSPILSALKNFWNSFIFLHFVCCTVDENVQKDSQVSLIKDSQRVKNSRYRNLVSVVELPLKDQYWLMSIVLRIRIVSSFQIAIWYCTQIIINYMFWIDCQMLFCGYIPITWTWFKKNKWPCLPNITEHTPVKFSLYSSKQQQQR